MVLVIDEMIDDLFSHNEIIGLWVEQQNENGKYHQQFWRGEAWKMPDKFRQAQFDYFFGTIPEHIGEADTLNICVKEVSWNFRYDPEYAEKFLRGDQEVKIPDREGAIDGYGNQ